MISNQFLIYDDLKGSSKYRIYILSKLIHNPTPHKYNPPHTRPLLRVKLEAFQDPSIVLLCDRLFDPVAVVSHFGIDAWNALGGASDAPGGDSSEAAGRDVGGGGPVATHQWPA